MAPKDDIFCELLLTEKDNIPSANDIPSSLCQTPSEIASQQRCPAGTGSIESVILTFGSNAISADGTDFAQDTQKTLLEDVHYVDLTLNSLHLLN